RECAPDPRRHGLDPTSLRACGAALRVRQAEDEMKLERCPTAPLIEARRDGRLSERESASLTRHLATCPSCASLAEDLERITTLLRAPSRSVSPLLRQRGRLRLLREAALGASPRPSSTRRSRPALLVAIAAVAAIAAIALGTL